MHTKVDGYSQLDARYIQEIKLKTKNEMLRRNGPVIKSVESVLQAGRDGGKDL